MNRHRNRAFAVETLLLTLFFLLALALLVQLFGAAQAMGRQARQETDAALLLQNASAQLHAGADPWAQAMADAAQTGAPQTAEAAFAADGTPAPAGAANAYTVRIAFTPAPQPTGTLLQAQVDVLTPAGDRLAGLTTAHYLPAP